LKRNSTKYIGEKFFSLKKLKQRGFVPHGLLRSKTADFLCKTKRNKAKRSEKEKRSGVKQSIIKTARQYGYETKRKTKWGRLLVLLSLDLSSHKFLIKINLSLLFLAIEV
jgi:hypothetical protein